MYYSKMGCMVKQYSLIVDHTAHTGNKQKLLLSLMLKVFKRFSSGGVLTTMDTLYRSIENEVQEPLSGRVSQGEVPPWVNGSLYRNGPGMYEVGEHKFQHWFGGLAMIQKFHIFDGSVTYQRKFLPSDTYKKSLETKRIAFFQFGTPSSPDPCKNIFSRFLTVFEPYQFSDNTLVHVFPVKDDLYTATETVYMNRIDPETLDILEKVNLEQKTSATLATPHPHVESDGSMHNLGHCFKRGLFTVLVKVPPKKVGESEFPDGEVVCKLSSPWALSISYFHSFGITENYYVFVQQPLLSNIPKVLIGRNTGKAFDSSLAFYPDIKTQFRIIDRKTGKEVNKKIPYQSDPFLIFHHINAYEEDGHIILDLCCHKDKSILDTMYMKHLSSPEAEEGFRKVGPPQVRRYVLPMNLDIKDQSPDKNLVLLENTEATCRMLDGKAVHCAPQLLSEVGMEFPQINYNKYNGKKYRFMYGVGFHSTGSPSQTLVKIDAEERTCAEWKEMYCFPSEPVFIPRPGSTEEDDGVLVAAINHAGETADSNSCFLLFLDGKTMAETARVEFEGIDRFPRDLHGAYAADDTKL